jgi:four helix bundle protein
MRDIRKYEVFQLADQLVLEVYRLTGGFPESEIFGLTSQTRRAASSIPMNLAEGAARAGAKEFSQFVNVASVPARKSATSFTYRRHWARSRRPNRRDSTRSMKALRRCLRNSWEL